MGKAHSSLMERLDGMGSDQQRLEAQLSALQGQLKASSGGQ
jgi:hypothetical protein